MDLKDKTVIVTGGAMGIGKACCARFAAEGANVVMTDINRETGEESASQIGENCCFIEADISSEEDISRLKEEVLARFGSIDVLVNNAAVQTENSFFAMTPAEFRRVINVNLIGTFICCNILGSAMKKGSTVVNMLSVHHSVPRRNKYHYDAAKAGVAMLTKEMALELAERGITVNGISYGACRTPMNSSWLSSPDQVTAVENKIPLRWIAEPEEIAAFTAAVVREFSGRATGSIFTFDGGRSL